MLSQRCGAALRRYEGKCCDDTDVEAEDFAFYVLLALTFSRTRCIRMELSKLSKKQEVYIPLIVGLIMVSYSSAALQISNKNANSGSKLSQAGSGAPSPDANRIKSTAEGSLSASALPKG